MEADYNPDSGYHNGSIAVQEAKAHLGMFKSTDEVPVRYQLSNFSRGLDAEEIWDTFTEEIGGNWSEHTLKYRYKSPWERWSDFAKSRGVNPVTPTAEDIEDWFCEAKENTASLDTCHDLHFRVLMAMFEWLVERADYPHKYNPVLQSALLGGVGEELWEVRVLRRKKYKNRWEANKDD